MTHWSENNTVSFTTYANAIRNAISVPEEFILGNMHRISRAHEAGEPVWMIAEELRLVFDMRVRATKTPRALALRVVRV
jgi:hypothetical protein